ncbi:MAG: heme-binding protein [Candidatus Tectomicrobia bacterium]
MAYRTFVLVVGFFGAVALYASPAFAGDNCSALSLGNKNAIHAALTAALQGVAPNQPANGGLGNNMWATLVDDDGVVCAVTFTGITRNDQWPGSRAISAQKANTAISFNLPAGLGGTVDTLSTANLWTQAQPGGSLFGLQFSNPVDTKVAYGGNANKYGATNDPMVGKRIGGVNVFGGGLGLYDASGNKVGGIGVSGDTSCADHNIAWRTRNALNLDMLTTGGVSGLSVIPRQDNISYDLDEVTPDHHHAADNSTSGFGHPKCGFGEDVVVLPATQ